MDKQLSRQGTLVISKTATVIITQTTEYSSSTNRNNPVAAKSRPVAFLLSPNPEKNVTSKPIIQIKRPPWRPAGPLHCAEQFKPMLRQPQQSAESTNYPPSAKDGPANRRTKPTGQETVSTSSRKALRNYQDRPPAGVRTKTSGSVAECLHWEARPCCNTKPQAPKDFKRFY